MSEEVMKRSDLFREYARVIDLCEGTKVNSYECVRLDGKDNHLAGLSFLDKNTDYTFAIAIVEDKPVFAGDVLYCLNIMFSVTEFSDGKLSGGSEENGFVKALSSYCSWTKPDPFADLLKAQAEGKRIVFFDGAKWVDVDTIDTVNFKPESYKVVERDKCEEHILNRLFGEHKTIKFTKCGITGNITTEVIE